MQIVEVKLEERRDPDTKPRLVWISSSETVNEGTFSVVAAGEVLLAVAGYWALAYWTHSQVQLLIAILVAPLLLLRSDQSVELGLRLFSSLDPVVDDSNWMGRLSDKINDYDGFESNRILAIVYRWVVGVPLTLLIVVAFLMAFFIRIFATLFYLFPGIKSLSKNWWRTLFATDVFTLPEIIPGHSNKKSMFSPQRMIETIRIGALNQEDIRHSLVLRAVFILGICSILIAVLGPAYFYRMSIKSTAWVHWPLVYISRPLRYVDDPDEVRARLWEDPREWLRRMTMCMTLIGALVASVPSFGAVKAVFPTGVLSIAEYAVLIDVRSLVVNPWRAFALVSACITLFLTWYGFELSFLIKRSKARVDRMLSARKWAAIFEYAMRIRDICGWTFWGLVFVHAALWLAPSTSWLRGYPQEILQFMYGPYLPPGLT
jgi:hypothetical protein